MVRPRDACGDLDGSRSSRVRRWRRPAHKTQRPARVAASGTTGYLQSSGTCMRKDEKISGNGTHPSYISSSKYLGAGTVGDIAARYINHKCESLECNISES